MYSPERKEQVLQEIEKSCIGMDVRLKKLRKKYKSDLSVLNALANYDDCIEAESKCDLPDNKHQNHIAVAWCIILDYTERVVQLNIIAVNQ